MSLWVPCCCQRQNHPNWKRLTKALTLLRKAWLKSWRGWGCRAAGKFLIFHPRKTGLSLQHGGKKRARHFFGPFLLFHMPPHVQANLHAVSLSFQGKFPVCREWGWAWNYHIDTDLFLDGDARTACFFTKTSLIVLETLVLGTAICQKEEYKINLHIVAIIDSSLVIEDYHSFLCGYR